MQYSDITVTMKLDRLFNNFARANSDSSTFTSAKLSCPLCWKLYPEHIVSTANSSSRNTAIVSFRSSRSRLTARCNLSVCRVSLSLSLSCQHWALEASVGGPAQCHELNSTPLSIVSFRRSGWMWKCSTTSSFLIIISWPTGTGTYYTLQSAGSQCLTRVQFTSTCLCGPESKALLRPKCFILRGRSILSGTSSEMQ